ncbi:ComEC/Rec2 family competence protein [Galactobacter sp.]|uniref:ComEC/Rec2 family competence protein n=1 Tax=Galactobacter sp. TaxID=2676125 RepID=UPI0025C486B0|nr:ComEC/Rec2 family competence protein [Galactobacter sp.]
MAEAWKESGLRALAGAMTVVVPSAVVLLAGLHYTQRGWGSATALVMSSLALASAAGLWLLGTQRGAKPGDRGRRWCSLAAVGCVGLAVLGAGSAADARTRQGVLDLLAAQRTRLGLELTASPAEAGEVLLASATVVSGTGSGATVLLVLPRTLVRDREEWDRGTRFSGWFAPSDLDGRRAEAARVRLVSAPLTGPDQASDALSAQRRALTRLYRGGHADGGAALVPCMVAGDRSLQSSRLSDAMTQAGLSHVTAVSGSNISVLISAVAAAGRFLRLPRWARAPATITAVVAFVLLVGPDPPVLRAAVMGGLAAVAVVSGRPRIGVLLVTTAAALLVCADPWQLTRVGFRLSVVACLGITLIGPPLTKGLQRLHVPRMLAESVSVSVAATLACTPELVGLSSEQSPLIVPVNVVAAPFVVVVGTLGPLLLLLAPLGSLLCLPLVEACRWAAQVVAWLGLASAERGPRIHWPEAPWGVVLGAALCWAVPGALILAARTGIPEAFRRRPLRFLRCGDGKPGHGGHGGGRVGTGLGRARRRVITVVLTVAVSGVGGGLVATVPAARTVLGLPGPHPEVLPGDVLLCDVGQGDAMVLVADAGRGVLLDAGPDEGDVAGCLGKAKVDRLCAAMISHLDVDHVGGLPQALGAAPADEVVYGTAGRKAPTTHATRGVPGHEVTCHPWTVRIMRAPAAADENDASLVLRAVSDAGAGVDLLTAGDAEELAGKAAVAAGAADPAAGRSRLLKISHHGSANGGTDLMRTFRPDAALIGVGADNGYGHPSPTIIDALTASSIPVLRTDQDGTVLLRSTAQGLRVVRHVRPD